ncbi:MAG: hypothetical protein ACRD0H_30430 [Actinomycetes bacterium]
MDATDLDARIAAMDPSDPDLKARSDQALASIIELTGAPGLDDYRKVFAALKLPWPGDEQIRQRYPVAV